MATARIAHDGYGQLELNQVAFRRDGRIEAQCAIDSALTADYIENGMLLAIDPVARTVKYPAAADAKALLNYTTEHMYDERTPGLKNFRLMKNSFLPRLGYLATGDKFTTNTVSYDTTTYTTEEAFWTAVEACGTTAMYGHSSTDGSILVNTTATNAALQVVKATTMPDGQDAIQFIAL